jgi:hypothetical protein
LAESFADRWVRKERECGLDTIAATLIPCGADVLPDSAAPRVTFRQAADPAPIWVAYPDSSSWTQLDREHLAPYRVIGSDGAGNPICVDEGTGAVAILDREYRFRAKQFVNSSLRQLGECLLAYMGENDAVRFRAAVMEIDPDALAERAFWWQEEGKLAAE